MADNGEREEGREREGLSERKRRERKEKRDKRQETRENTRDH